MSTTKDIHKVKKYYDGWADENSKDKVTWDEAWREHCPNPDVLPYVADEAEFQELKKKFASRNVGISFSHEGWIQADKKFNDDYKAYRDRNAVEIDLMSMAIREEVGFPLDKMNENYTEFQWMTYVMFKATELERSRDAMFIVPETATRRCSVS